jgi:hypothetical protein
MKGKIFALLVLGMSLSLCTARADITTRDRIYKVWIENEITRCRLKANFVNSRGENLQCYGQKAVNQVVFYQHSMLRLVHDMAEESVGMQSYRINYFLIRAYKNYESLSRLAA